MFSPRGLVLKVLVLALLVGAGSYLSTVRPSADVFMSQAAPCTIPSAPSLDTFGTGQYDSRYHTLRIDGGMNKRYKVGDTAVITLGPGKDSSDGTVGASGFSIHNNVDGKPFFELIDWSPKAGESVTLDPAWLNTGESRFSFQTTPSTAYSATIKFLAPTYDYRNDVDLTVGGYGWRAVSASGNGEAVNYLLVEEVPILTVAPQNASGQVTIQDESSETVWLETTVNHPGEVLLSVEGGKIYEVQTLLTDGRYSKVYDSDWVPQADLTVGNLAYKTRGQVKLTDQHFRYYGMTRTTRWQMKADTYGLPTGINGVSSRDLKYTVTYTGACGSQVTKNVTQSVYFPSLEEAKQRAIRDANRTTSPTASVTPTITQSVVTTPPSPTSTQTTTLDSTPTVTLTADPSEITAGEKTTLKWRSTNATGVAESNFDIKDVSGEKQLSPTETTTYSLVVQGNQTTARAEAKVTIKAAPTTTPSETVQASPAASTTPAVQTTNQSPAPTTSTPTASATTQATKKATATPTPSSTPPPPTVTTSPPIDRSSTISETVQFVKIGGETKDLGQAVTVDQGAPIQLGVVQGTAKPGETVTVTVYSEPKTYTVTADANGHWSLEIPTADLEAGEHRIEYETPTKPKAELMKFTVAAAQSTETPTTDPTSVAPITSSIADIESDPFSAESGSFLEALVGSMPWWGWIVVVFVLGILIYLFLHSRKLAAHNLHEPDDAMHRYPTTPPSDGGQN